MRLTPLYGFLAGFEKPEEVAQAAKKAFDAGYRKMDAYSPFPVEHLYDNLGYKSDKKIQAIFLVAGVCGALIAYWMQAFSATRAWPLDIGGKPLNTWPMFIPITFETTVLASSVAGFLGMLILNFLPEPYHPVFNVPEFKRASRDRFFLLIEAADPKFDHDRTWSFLKTLNPYYLSPVAR